MFGQKGRIAQSDAVITDRDDRAFNLLLTKPGDLIDRPKYRYLIHLRPRQAWIGIQKTHDSVFARGLQYIKDHFTVATRANDDQIH